MARRGFLHVLNGDSVRVPLERSTVQGVLLVYPDILHEGPTPLVTGDEWRRVRSRFLADGDPAREQAILQGYRETDATLESYGDVDEVVFWFEHDLFDQLLLIRHLHWLSRVADRRGTRFSLICIGEFPGVPGFAGLGQLNAEQLASLLEPRVPITDDAGRPRRTRVGRLLRAGPGRSRSVCRHALVSAAVPGGRVRSPPGGFSVDAQRALAERTADSRGGRRWRGVARRGVHARRADGSGRLHGRLDVLDDRDATRRQRRIR